MCISTGGEVLFARGGLPRRSLSCTFPVQGRLRYLVGRNPPHPSLLPCTFLLISHPACLCTHQSVQHASPHPRLYTALYCTPTTLVQRSYSYYALTRMHQSHASPACITRMHRLNASPVFRSHPQPHTAHARFPLAPIHTFGPTTLSSPTNHPQNHHPHAPPARRRISLHQPPRPHRRTGGHTPTPIRNTTTLSPQRFATHRCLDGCSLPWFHSVTPPCPHRCSGGWVSPVVTAPPPGSRSTPRGLALLYRSMQSTSPAETTCQCYAIRQSGNQCYAIRPG